MLDLPKSTEFNRRIPKQKFYENLTVTPAMKKIFTEQIKMIYWRNKLAASTLNIAAGEQVTEIEVFEVRLSTPGLDENVLRLIDREIPYHILFLLEYEGKYQAVMGYKDAAVSGKAAFKVERYYHTEWMDEAELPLHLEGLTLDTIYEHFIQQKQREQLEKQIATLEARIRKEKQPKKKFELATKAKILKKQLSELEKQGKDGIVHD